MNNDDTTPVQAPSAPEPSTTPPTTGPGADTTRFTPSRWRPVAAGVAAGVGVLALAGIGIGAAAALNDRSPFDTVPAATAPSADPTSGTPGTPGDDGSGTASPTAEAGAAPADGSTPSDLSSAAATAGEASALVAAIDAAVAAAQGTGASSVEVERSGWSVDVILPDGTEVDVRVAADGSTTVRADHRDDDRADPAIDTARVPEIVAAATTAAQGGAVISIETYDEGRYDVDVLLPGGNEVDIELTAAGVATVVRD